MCSTHYVDLNGQEKCTKYEVILDGKTQTMLIDHQNKKFIVTGNWSDDFSAISIELNGVETKERYKAKRYFNDSHVIEDVVSYNNTKFSKTWKRVA